MSNIRSESVTATGAVYAGRCRLKNVIWTGGTVPGDLTLRNENGSGAILLQIAVNASNYNSNIDVPENGILFPDGIHCTIGANVATKVNCLIEG
jgi:hypothetical protein